MKIAENVFFYITLCLWGILCILYSELRGHTEFAYPILVICIIEVILTGTLYLDIRELILVIGWFAYYCIGAGKIAFDISILLVFEFFFLGEMFIMNAGKNYLKRMIQWFSVMAISMCIGSILDFTSFAAVEGTRMAHWYRFWSGNIESCTHYAFYAIPIVCLVFWAVCTFTKHIILSILIIVGAVIMNIQMLMSYTRMIAVISLLVFLVMAVAYFVYNYKKKYVRIIYGVTIITGLLFVAFVMRYMLSHDELYNIVYRNLSRNNGILHNMRLEMMAEVLRQLPGHPMGDIDIELGLYAHNVWLDIAKLRGVIPFLIMIIYSAICVYDAVVCMTKSNDEDGSAYYIVALLFGLHIYYMIEPAYIASMYFWATGCMVSGVIRAFNIKAAKVRKRKAKGIKKAPVIMAMLVMCMSLSGCSMLDDLVVDSEDTDEYIDTAEYDDIAFMGEGTKEDPYLINDYNDLIYFYNSVNTGWLFDNKYILQTNDIDMSDHPFWPIAECDTGYAFLGTYDGGGHVIRNVTLCKDLYSAIFGRLGGTIMNLGIEDGYIQGWHAAGLVSMCVSDDAKILNCYTATSLQGKETVGIVDSGKGQVLGCYARSTYFASDECERISLKENFIIDGCYAEWSMDGVASLFYENNTAVYLFDDDRISKADAADHLNDYVYEMSYRSDIPVEDFCRWKLNDEGNVCLSTRKAEPRQMPEELLLRKWAQDNYPMIPIFLGIMITIITVIATIRIAKK